MTIHRYNPPERKPSQWGGLSDEAKAALSHVAMGPSVAGELVASDISSLESLAPGVLDWLITELNSDPANEVFGSWQRYETQLGSTVPRVLDDLFRTNPNLISTLNRLHNAKQELTASGGITPDGLNIGETMHLVLMPWQAMRDHLTDFSEWVNAMRDAQHIATLNDVIDRRITDAIGHNQALYRDMDNPAHLLTSTEYLDGRIAADGPWGIMLVQTVRDAGIKQMMGESPNAMTEDGTQHLELAGQPIDALGIFEWLALTMQKDPRQLSSADYSWLLANRLLMVGGDELVPSGDWSTSGSNGFVRSTTTRANFLSSSMVVRPAVM